MLCYLLLLMLAISATLGQERDIETVDAELAQLRATCRAEVTVDDDVFNRAVAKDIDENDRNLQCYCKCTLMKWNVLQDDGTFDLNSLYETVPKERKSIYEKPSKECVNEKDDDLCALGMKIYKCYQKHMGDNFVFF